MNGNRKHEKEKVIYRHQKPQRKREKLEIRENESTNESGNVKKKNINKNTVDNEKCRYEKNKKIGKELKMQKDKSKF